MQSNQAVDPRATRLGPDITSLLALNNFGLLFFSVCEVYAVMASILYQLLLGIFYISIYDEWISPPRKYLI